MCENSADSPAVLVAIIVAAHKVGDRDLELAMRERLRVEYGVKLTFAREAFCRDPKPCPA